MRKYQANREGSRPVSLSSLLLPDRLVGTRELHTIVEQLPARQTNKDSRHLLGPCRKGQPVKKEVTGRNDSKIAR